jgi:FkbM family methyltransferase
MGIVIVSDKVIGQYQAFQTENSKKAFKNPMGVNRSIPLLSSDIVVDIGAYVGEFSMYAADSHVAKVRSYEATPATFELLKQNARPPMEVINRAVVGNDSPSVKLYLSKGVGVTNSIAKVKPDFITVPAIRYEEAINDATIVKIDVEGGEYLYNIIQPQLRAILLEFHPIARKPWLTWAKDIMQKMEDAGFRGVRVPTFKNGWDLTGSWVREVI